MTWMTSRFPSWPIAADVSSRSQRPVEGLQGLHLLDLPGLLSFQVPLQPGFEVLEVDDRPDEQTEQAEEGEPGGLMTSYARTLQQFCLLKLQLFKFLCETD